jgi:pilus assembly protein Flp/PilA
MGETPRLRPVPDAAGRCADRGLAARSDLKRFRRDASGATAIEYGLIASLIAAAIVGSVSLLGEKNSQSMQKSADAISAAIN